MKISPPSEIRPSVTFQSRPIVSNMAVLHGKFKPEGRSPFSDPFVEKAIKRAVAEGLSDLPGWHEPRIRAIFQLASRGQDERQLVHPGLDPEDPFYVPWPVHLGLPSSESSCLLCVGVGSAFPSLGDDSAISRDAFDDFLKLESPEDCLGFTRRWGLLGNWRGGARTYTISAKSDAENRVAVAQELRAQGLLGDESTSLENGIRGSVYGEPLDAWLWHVARLRTWRVLLRTSNLRRQLGFLNRPIEAFRLPKPGHSPAEGVLLEGWFVPHLSADLLRPANTEDLEAIKNAKAWDYAVHQEGGFLRFAHQRFGPLREISKKSLDVRFELEVVKLVRQLLQETLAGKASFQPFSMDGFATVEPESLLAWLYLEFANRHADVLGGTVRSAPCENPGCQKLAVYRGSGRIRRYCSDSCKTAANKKRRLTESLSD